MKRFNLLMVALLFLCGFLYGCGEDNEIVTGDSDSKIFSATINEVRVEEYGYRQYNLIILLKIRNYSSKELSFVPTLQELFFSQFPFVLRLSDQNVIYYENGPFEDELPSWSGPIAILPYGEAKGELTFHDFDPFPEKGSYKLVVRAGGEEEIVELHYNLPSNEDYFPLKVGNSWTYQRLVNDKPISTYTERVVRTVVDDLSGKIYFLNDGGDCYRKPIPETIIGKERITVPAGTFECIVDRHPFLLQTTWFAKGVGPVKIDYDPGGIEGGGLRETDHVVDVLISYHLN